MLMSVSGQDLCDNAIDLALQKGATYAEARFESLQNNQFVLKNGNCQSIFFKRGSYLYL